MPYCHHCNQLHPILTSCPNTWTGGSALLGLSDYTELHPSLILNPLLMSALLDKIDTIREALRCSNPRPGIKMLDDLAVRLRECPACALGICLIHLERQDPSSV